MDYDGLMIKYKYRASSILTEEEMSHQLRQHEPIDLQGKRVMDDTAVIHLSSNYMEIVDKYYSVKGFLTVPSLAGGGLCVWFACSFYYTMFMHYFFEHDPDNWFYISGFIMAGVATLLAWGIYFLLRVECFRWTHYPVRFDRKHQLVHVFSVDGEVYSVPWSEIFFTTGCYVQRKFKRKYYDIRGHVLAEDCKTVLKTFTLAVSASSREQLYPHWEFVRRYMEEGPQAVAEVLKIMPPVEGRREGVFFGYWYLMFSATYGAPVFLVPFLMVLYLAAWPFRVFAMYTSKIPRWTAEVEAMCQIDPDDPWDISAAQNPRSIWRWMLGMDKAHTMLDKKRQSLSMSK